MALEDDAGSPVLEVEATPEDGRMAEEGLRLKLDESFVRNPVDAPVPVG